MFWKWGRKAKERKRQLKGDLEILEEQREIARELKMTKDEIRRKLHEAKTEEEEHFWFDILLCRKLEEFEKSEAWMEAFRLMG